MAGGGGLWAAGEAYEPYVGRWSRRVAPEFLARLGAPSGARWLDVGCGTGALSEAILASHEPAAILGVDPSEGFLAHARHHLADPRVTFRAGDAQALPAETGAFDIAVAGLVLNFVPDPARGVAEMRRALRPGGRAAAYVWDYAEGMQMMRRFWDAAAALDPAGAGGRDEALRFPLCRPDPLRALFEGAGFRAVEVWAIEVPTVFRDFDDYWSPFLAGGAPAPAYCAALPEPARTALRERLRATLPVAEGGRIPLSARAWAVGGHGLSRPDQPLPATTTMAGFSSRPCSVQAGVQAWITVPGSTPSGAGCSAIAWCSSGSKAAPWASRFWMPCRSSMATKPRSTPSKPLRSFVSSSLSPSSAGGRLSRPRRRFSAVSTTSRANFCTA
jgi:SAM-dependent methyltransferase